MYKNEDNKKDESYIIDLCDEVLGMKAWRQHRFDFLLGDSGKNGRRVKLPVDAYYEQINLVIEYRERQHTEDVKFFNKPDKITVSGVHRGIQREMYDQRRREILPQHGIKLIDLSYDNFRYDSNKRIIRDKRKDLDIIRIKLKEYINLV